MRISLRTLGVLAVVAVVGAALVLGVDAMAASGVGEHVTPFAILANAAAPAADIDKLRNSVDKFMNAFEEFKTTNDENLRKRCACGSSLSGRWAFSRATSLSWRMWQLLMVMTLRTTQIHTLKRRRRPLRT